MAKNAHLGCCQLAAVVEAVAAPAEAVEAGLELAISVENVVASERAALLLAEDTAAAVAVVVLHLVEATKGHPMVDILH